MKKLTNYRFFNRSLIDSLKAQMNKIKFITKVPIKYTKLINFLLFVDAMPYYQITYFEKDVVYSGSV